MHGVAIFFPLGTALASLFLDLYNPPALATGCYLASYPVGCQSDPAVECTRGQNAILYTFLFAGLIVFPSFVIVLFSMALLVWMVRRNSVYMQRRYSDFRNQNVSASADFRLAQTVTQALLYITAFVMSTIWSGVILILAQGKSTATYLSLTLLAQIFFPLQGFMNFFIFIRPRYMNLRRKHPDLWFWTLMAGIFDERRLPSQTLSSNAMQENARTTGLSGSNHSRGVFFSNAPRRTRGSRQGESTDSAEHTIEFFIDVEESPLSSTAEKAEKSEEENDAVFANHSRASFVTVDTREQTSMSD